MRRFSDVREPFDITSKRHLESVSSCRGMTLDTIWLIFFAIVTVVSLMSAKDMTSSAMEERVIRRDLYDLKTNGTVLPDELQSKII